MSSTKKASDAGEWRRQRAWELHQHGWWQKDIAAALGVSRAAVCQWIKSGREQGVEGLRSRPHPGAPSRLTAEQRAQIPSLLAQGAEAHGVRVMVDRAPDRGRDRARLRRALSSGARRSAAAPGGLERAATDPAGDTT